MPQEGPNGSEELLKRYARERRKQSGTPSLHPATRRLLQGEVTRQYGKQSASEKGGFSRWLGMMRGRLTMATALVAVFVIGASLWWNNQQPRTMELAKAERPRPSQDMAPSPTALGDEMKLKAEKQIAAVDQVSDVGLNSASRRLTVPSPAEPEMKREAKLNEALTASVAPNKPRQITAALKDPSASSITSVDSADKTLGDIALGLAVVSTESASNTLAQRIEMAFTDSSLTSSSPRAFFAGGAGSGTTTTNNRTDLALGYSLAGAASVPVESRATAPSVAVNYDTEENKNLSKSSVTTKLAANRPVTLARTESESVDRSRSAGLEPRAAPMLSPPATTPPLALGENAGADKRQQPLATSQLRGAPVAQASAARPEPVEQMARFYRQSVIRPDASAKQKASRELDRRDAELPVLNRFVIEQQGNTVRVVDADGSVYDGIVEEPVVTGAETEFFEKSTEIKDHLTREKPVALKSASGPRTDGYSFRASGSNVTLQQLVVVNGRLVSGVDTASRAGAAGPAGGLGSIPMNAPARALKENTVSNRGDSAQRPGFGGKYGFTTNQSATIEGTVRIGVTNQQWFRAVRDSR